MAVSPYNRLVGREAECSRLREALNHAAEGAGSLALVSGEAGIGKSRLANEIKRYAGEREFLVLTGGCYDLTTTAPYGPWVEALQGIAPDGAAFLPVWDTEGPDGARDQQAILDAILESLRNESRDGPLALVLEDVHWADQASLEALRYIARSTRDLPIVIAATYRDDELSSAHPLFETLPAVIRESEPLRLELGPLSIGNVDSLVTPLGLRPENRRRLASYLHRRAQGNPLFTQELLRSLIAEHLLRPGEDAIELGNIDSVQVPSLVVQLIERRLSKLDLDARSLLEIAAVIGHDVDVDFWSEAAGCSNGHLEDVVRQALAHHILEEADGQFRFTHALVRETIYSGIILPQRREVHRRIAERLAGRSQSDPDAVADHFLRAGDVRALPWVLRAGLRARTAAAWRDAAKRFVQAADLMSDDEDWMSERGWILMMAGSLLRYDDNERSAALIQQAAEIGIASGDRLLHADSIRNLGVAHCHRGQIGRGLAELRSGTAILENLGRSGHSTGEERKTDRIIRAIIAGELVSVEAAAVPLEFEGIDPKLVQARGLLVHWLAQSGRFAEALELGAQWARDDEALTRAGHSNFQWARAANHGLALSRQILGDSVQAEALWRRASGEAAIVGDFVVEAATLGRLVFGVLVPFYADQPARIADSLDEIRQASQRGERQAAGPRLGEFCDFYADLLAGRWDRARAFEERIVASSMSIFVNLVTPHLGSLARWQGRQEEAWDRVHQLLPQGVATPPGESYFVTPLSGLRLAAELELDAGNLDAARDWLEAYDRWLEWSGAVIGRSEGELGWSRYWLSAGELERARQHVMRGLGHASNPRQPLALLAANRALGALDIDRGSLDGAGDHLHQALSLARACRTPFDEALTLLESARLEAARGRTDAAKSLLDRAREIGKKLNAMPLVERAGSLETEWSRHEPALPDGLTPREVEVLALIAAGRSNREMAEDLFLSVRTVERHVANIYRKIDAHNRTEATRYAIRRGLVEMPTT